MSKRDDRLARCFASVFPGLSAEQIRAASVDSVTEWDSLASVTLVAVLEQEFGISVDLLDLPELSSFALVLNYLDRHGVISTS